MNIKQIKSYYFSHDINASEDIKMKKLLSKYGSLGYGIYWGIIEKLHDEMHNIDDIICILSFNRFGDSNTIENCINYCISLNLFVEKSGKLKSNRVDRNLEFLENRKTNLTKFRSNAGKKGGLKTQELRREKLNKINESQNEKN